MSNQVTVWSLTMTLHNCFNRERLQQLARKQKQRKCTMASRVDIQKKGFGKKQGSGWCKVGCVV